MPMRQRVGRTIDRTFSSLRCRNYRLFFFGQLISNTGNWLTIVALTLLVLHLTNSGIDVGLLTACQYGPILLLSAWAGAIADRSNKRTLLFVTQLLEMVQSFVLATLAFLPHPPLGALYATALAGGVMLAFDNPVRRSFVTEMVEPDEVPNAVVLYSALVNASRIFGPALAGALVVTLGYGWAFTIDGISYVAVLIGLALMRTSELRRVAIPPRTKGQVRAGIRYVASMTELWIPFVVLGVIGTLSYNFTVVFPLLVEHGLHGTDSTFTFVYAMFSLGALISALVATHRSEVGARPIMIGALALGLTMLGLAAVPNVGFAYPAVFLVGLASVWYMTATTAAVQVLADPVMHGRVLALQTVLLVGTTPIGGPIAGALADAFGSRTPVLVGAVAALAAGTWGWFALRRRAGLPEREPDPPPLPNFGPELGS